MASFIRATDVIAVDDSLLAQARALEPIIGQHAETTERQRRLARPALDAMREAGLLIAVRDPPVIADAGTWSRPICESRQGPSPHLCH